MNILILCTGNSCRSQIAEGFFRKFLHPDHDVESAGIEAHGLNPDAVFVMREIGIDISGQTSKTIESLTNMNFDIIITVCDNAKETCPYIPGSARRFHRDFPDPSKYKGSYEEILNEFRRVRNLIEEYCKKFVEEQKLK